MLTPLITFGQVLDAPGGRAVLERHLPGVADAPATADLRHLLVGAFLRVTPGLRDDPAARERFWAEVDEVMAPVLFHPHVEAVAAVAPGPTAERPSTGSGQVSGPWSLVGAPTRWGLLEIALRGPAEGNPFVDVELSAEFRCGDRTWTVGGFYDGEGVYRVRALAEEEGRWEFVTTSTAPVLDGIRGEVTVGPAAPDAHGPVRVDGFHFAYADGTRYRPWGTTAYAWNHQNESAAAGHPGHPGRDAFHQAADVPVPQALRVQHRRAGAVPLPARRRMGPSTTPGSTSTSSPGSTRSCGTSGSSAYRLT